MTASEVLPLFPTFVWKTQLAPHVWQPLNHRISHVLKSLAPELKQGQAWQSQHNLHESAEFREPLTYVHDGTNAVLEFLKVGYREVEVTA